MELLNLSLYDRYPIGRSSRSFFPYRCKRLGKLLSYVQNFCWMDWIQFPALRSQESLLEAGVVVVFRLFSPRGSVFLQCYVSEPLQMAHWYRTNPAVPAAQRLAVRWRERTERASFFHRVHVSPTCRPVHAENSVRGSLPLLLCIFAYAFRAVVWPVEVARALCCSLRLEVIKSVQNG